MSSSLKRLFPRAKLHSPEPGPVISVGSAFARLTALSVIAGLLVAVGVTPALVVGATTGSTVVTAFDEMPESIDLGESMLPTSLYLTNADGSTYRFATFYDQYRIPVNIDQVAPVLIDALLSSEDPRYFEHGGVDLRGTARALVSNVLGGGETQGGSSIAQQYIKNLNIQECEATAVDADALQACWDDATSASGTAGIARKLKEIRYALSLDKTYSKDEILTGYLNIANFGGRTYGIEAASQRYFGVSASALTLAQAATLAGMVQSPNSYRIDQPDNENNGAANGYALTLDRREYVLDRMLAEGKIDEAQHAEALAEPITPNIQPMTQGCGDAGGAAYFCQYVVAEILSNPAFGATPEDRAHTLRRGGLSVYTSLNGPMQLTAEEAIHSTVPAHLDGMDLGAAGVSIEAGTGRILTLVQNTQFSEDPSVTDVDPSYSSLVYAADFAHGGSGAFPVGSTYKLFTLIDWLENGRSIYETVNGRNRLFSSFTCDGEPVTNSDKIANFDNASGFYGTPVSFTAQSLNSGFLAMAAELDLCDINRVAERLGVHLGDGSSVTASNYPYETVLGSRSIAPIQMGAAYATVASGGTYCAPRAIDRVVRPDGTELDLAIPPCVQALDPEVAAAAAAALEAAADYGTAAASNPFDGTPLLGKTGTHEQTQTMVITSSSKVTTTVWVGNASGQTDLYDTYSDGQPITRLRHIVASAMQAAADSTYGGDSFPDPPRTMTEVPDRRGPDAPQAGTATVPDVEGSSPNSAAATLRNQGFSNVSQGDCSGGDTVTETDPEAGETVSTDTAITLYCD